MPSSLVHSKLPHGAIALACLGGSLLGAPTAAAGDASATGGAAFVPPPPPPAKAKIGPDGKVIAPLSAPPRVKRVIAAANRLVRKPYRWGGGHRPFSRGIDSGYDCSGSVSYALYGGRFLRSPLDSTGFMSWARRGTGRWITIYSSSSHAYVVVAGLRFDTSMRDKDSPGPASGPRWSKRLRRSAAFRPRHPAGY
jgi:hypothetical protein